jgi:O-acetylhomoserine (thiol)-lyase
MERHCSNALELARYLDSLGDDITVNYPGLESSPYHELATRQFNGGYGAIVTVRVGSKERAFNIINSLKIPFILSNIGDTKTLVLHPASTIAVHLSKEEQLQSGVYDDLIRISVGIEDVEDLKADFKQAIEITR